MEIINTYSGIHFIQYFLLGRYLLNSWKIFFVISIGWEFLELILPYQFAVEIWANKFSDVVFNCLGFYLGQSSKRGRPAQNRDIPQR